MLAEQERKIFDSADWALSKQGVKVEAPTTKEPSVLQHKTEPTVPGPRRISLLGDEDGQGVQTPPEGQ
jgi:hypothetical protein